MIAAWKKGPSSRLKATKVAIKAIKEPERFRYYACMCILFEDKYALAIHFNSIVIFNEKEEATERIFSTIICLDHELNDTAVFLLKYKSLKYFQIIRQRISFCFRIANFGH